MARKNESSPVSQWLKLASAALPAVEADQARFSRYPNHRENNIREAISIAEDYLRDGDLEKAWARIAPPPYHGLGLRGAAAHPGYGWEYCSASNIGAESYHRSEERSAWGNTTTVVSHRAGHERRRIWALFVLGLDQALSAESAGEDWAPSDELVARLREIEKD